MTACPCAQELVATRARERLREDGFSDEQIERIFARVPIATHNQRGLGTLHIGCVEDCEAEIDASVLLEIVESSMSSEIYELMKRSDEVAVVEKAHARPRFVEDCVREMLAGVVTRFPELDGRQLRVGAPGEPRDDPPAQRRSPNATGCSRELRRRDRVAAALPRHQTTLDEWLAAGIQPPPV